MSPLRRTLESLAEMRRTARRVSSVHGSVTCGLLATLALLQVFRDYVGNLRERVRKNRIFLELA